jgi:hypothetical protein
MTDTSSATRKIRTRLGVMTTRPCAMSELRDGERFVGPDGRSVYKVTTSCRKHPRRWLRVWNLSMTDAEVREGRAAPGAERDTDPRDGFFTYPQDTVMHRIV